MKRFWYIIKRLKPYKSWLAASVVSNIFMSIFTVISIPIFIPFFDLLFNPEKISKTKPVLSANFDVKEYFSYQVSNLIDGRSPKEALTYVILAFFLVFLLKNIFRYLGMFFITPPRNGFIRDLRKELYEHLIDLPVLYFKDKKKGDLLSRMSMDMQEIENSIMNGVDALIKAPLIIIGSIILMVYMSPKLTLFVLVLLPITVFLIGGVSRKMKQQSSEAQDYLGKILSIMEETLGSIKVIKSFNATPLFKSKFNQLNDKYRDTLTRLLWRKSIGSPLAEILGVIVLTLLMWYSATLVFDGELKATVFFAFIYAFFSIIEPAKAFSTAYYSFQKGAAALERVEEIMKVKNDIYDLENAVELIDFKDSIEFKNIWFKYPDAEEYVLKNINIKISKGEKIALIGASGAGKTTLADLLSRLYDIQKGEILIDGINIKNIKLKCLRNLVGIVSQDALLFHDNVLKNITFSDKNINQEDLDAAIKTALVDEFIPNMEKAKSTIIGDQGTKLSGGQKQRIAIARAVYKNAPILVLDEATSSLDSTSEKKVQQALHKMMENKTSIIIAHRLATIQEVDKIIVLENGKIIESGSPVELIKKEGTYFNFVQLQQI